VTLEADPNAATLQAIMINQCLKCHDSNGAMSASARVPVSVMPASSSAKPFGTTIAGATYTGAGVTANAILGGVVDVNEAFKTTNSSYHPVTGKQNNSYASGTRMAAPWVNTKTAGSITAWGPLISCWDCHALPTDAGTIVQTVTAHGGTATLRGNFLASGGTSTATSNVAVTLCVKCHAQYDTLSSSNHGTGSAFSGGGNGGMANALKWQCNKCHGSFWSDTAGTVATRPVRSFDVHGVNALPTGGKVPPATSRWGGSTTVGTPTGTANLRPYAFIRNTTALGSHSPLSGNGFTYSPNCTSPTANVSGCGSMSTYSVGGTY
jgi:hypothetical protein